MKYILSSLLLLISTLGQATTLSKMVVFGDSLSDNGNLYEYMKHQLPTSPPYFDGRFTNGPVWIEKFAEYYYPENTSEHLLDYAFGGSGVSEDDDEDDFEAGALFNLTREVDSYLLSHHDMANDQSLYIFWMGSNNYIALPDDANKTVLAVNDGIQKEIERLISKGAKYFMIMTVPDLGRTPGAVDFDAVNFLTDITNQHNSLLNQRVNQLQAKYPQTQFIFFDVNRTFLEALDEPEIYGFTNITGTCYEAAMVQPSSKTILKMAASIRSTSNHACDGYLFFDIIHPTAAAHAYIADKAQELVRQSQIEFN